MPSEQTSNQYVGHPDDQWQRDLNPEPKAGFNIGPEGEKPGRFDLTAADIDGLHSQLSEFSPEEMRQIPVLKPETRLEQGATYLNLNGEQQREFTGMANQATGSEDYIVPKSAVPYPLWNRLTGAS
ncbi:hypothetical protein C7271_09640 [filamentous cyanobacterium CCP5]|nr:hypothetical protein C7271_09640 [filamentous cyanobacterium CCP5]